MICLVLGTSEGKEILSKINEFTENIVVSTATEYGATLLKDYKMKYINSNPLDFDGFVELAKRFNIKVFVDASHPYATEVSNILINMCKYLNIKYLRYERQGVFEYFKDNKDILKIDNYLELENILKDIHGNVLNTTGSNHVTIINNLNINNRIIHRVLPSPKIIKKLIDEGIKLENIIAMKGPFGKAINDGIIKEYNIEVLITKDSGAEGGVIEKIESALENNVKVIVISKPKLNYGNIFNNINDIINYLNTLKEGEIL